MSDIAIRVENLSKKYKIGANQARYQTLRESIVNGFSNSIERLKGVSPKEENIIWALKDINFEVKHGEVLGIIGRNGAGKSTLLKILSRITKPTTGRFELNGRVGSLLEVGTGFHPELTGRDNIYLSGAILGMKRNEINRKFDEIVDFAEIEKFLDTPVKHYSSGMYMRLAFSVAAHLEPEILLVDEVLAVGDAEFQKKCLGKMGDVAGQGRTVLFVSHNMGAIINLCLTSIMLQRGMLSFKGTSNQAISYYTSGRKATTHDNLEQIVNRKGNGIAKFTYIFLEDETGKKVSQAISGSPITIVLGYKSKKNQINNCRISIAFYNSSGQALFNCSSELTSKNSINLPAEGIIRCRIPKLPLTQSQYTIIPFLESNKEILDWVINGVNFDVIDGDYYGTGRLYPDGWQGKGVLVDQNWSFT